MRSLTYTVILVCTVHMKVRQALTRWDRYWPGETGTDQVRQALTLTRVHLCWPRMTQEVLWAPSYNFVVEHMLLWFTVHRVSQQLHPHPHPPYPHPPSMCLALAHAACLTVLRMLKIPCPSSDTRQPNGNEVETPGGGEGGVVAGCVEDWEWQRVQF